MSDEAYSELDRELDAAIQQRRMPSLHIVRFAHAHRPTKAKVLIEILQHDNRATFRDRSGASAEITDSERKALHDQH